MQLQFFRNSLINSHKQRICLYGQFLGGKCEHNLSSPWREATRGRWCEAPDSARKIGNGFFDIFSAGHCVRFAKNNALSSGRPWTEGYLGTIDRVGFGKASGGPNNQRNTMYPASAPTS